MSKLKLTSENILEPIEMRKMYCNTLIEIAKNNENIVALDADLMSSMGMLPFGEKFPERMFDCGIQEANMAGVASGLSAVGKIPFMHTFGPFATRRCFDQVFLSCAYAKQNVKIIGSDPGVTAAYNGGTHMPFEDLGLMRLIPDATVIVPSDSKLLEFCIKEMEKAYGIHYVRLLRKNAISIYDNGNEFEIGKANLLCDGKDITIIACGICVSDALLAAKLLKEKGISVRVLDMFTIKPIDKAAIINAALETGAIVTVENHNIIGGLGSAVSDVVLETKLVPIGKVGIQDKFGQVGTVDYLKKQYNLTVQDIIKCVEATIERK